MIPNQWYPILESRQLSRNTPLGVMRLGERLVLWREANGRIACMPDRCPHRSAMLSRGKIRDGCIVCPYHGLRFPSGGRCTIIPANGCDAAVPEGFNLTPISVREEHGVVWYWYGAQQPTDELPWPREIAELGGNTVSIHYDTEVPQLRAVENVFDFHHLNFVHRWTFPGVGPRVDDFKATQNGDEIAFSGTLRHERAGWMKHDSQFSAKFRFPAVCSIKSGGIDIALAFTPIDANKTWICARYTQHYLTSFPSGGILARLFAILDYFAFKFEDIHILRSQLDPVGDISRFHLCEADRAIGLFFAMVKRAMPETPPPEDRAGRENHINAAAGR